MLDKLVALLFVHEGYRAHPYRCTAGKRTVGIGRNIDDKGISKDELVDIFEQDGLSMKAALILLNNDIDEVTTDLRMKLPYFNTLDPVRRAVLIDMGINLGVGGLLKFTHFLESVENRSFTLASEQMMQSKWARQVGQRAIRLSRMMRYGTWPDLDLPETLTNS